ncbi:MAG: AAA family ATPase, partial [Nannocystaceae bacterium]
LTWCAGAAGRPTLPGAAAWRPERPVLLDREEQLGEIQEALAEVSAGHPACVDIHGAPGTGKSALVRAFLEPLRAVAQVVILEARCSERESVPYRAFDGIIDGLAAALRSLTADQRWLLLGDLRQEFDALCQIFPVLRRADPEIERRGTAATGSSLVSRHHAFIGLKRLLHRLAQLSTLVVVIEELHRADADSVRLLVELLSPPDVPAMLLVCTYDTLPGQRVEVLADLEHFRAVVTSTYSLRILTTGALAERDAVELAVQLMGGRRIAKVVERAQAIAAEAEGNPLLISSLVRESDPLEPEERSDAGTLLRRVVDRRLAELHPAARELLALFMVSRGEIELELIRQAMPDHVDPRTLLTQLRGVRMLRISQRAGVLQVEAQHHQLHEAILDGIGEELIRESHRRLARAMRELEIEDSERVAHHLAHAGERHEAAEFAARAAHEAARSLAFDRAAELYCLAVECRPDHWAYCRRCADALVQAGRGTEAAEYYLAAAERAPAKALELRTAAAEQFLLGGHVEAGLEVARPLLERLGIGLPVEAEELDALFTEHVGRLVRRGLAFQERGELEVYSEELGVVDLLWALGRGLVLNDPVRGGYFLLRGVTKALDAGEPHRIARFLALVGLFTANFDPVRGLDAFAVAEAVAGSIRDEYAIGLVSICRGICHRDAGTWYVALSDLEFGVTHLRDHCDHAGWECSLALRSITGVLEALGELRTLEHRAQTFHQIAQESGDVLLGLLATMSSAFTLLAASSPGEARARVQHALHFWPRSGFHVQHLHALKIEALCDLHEGDAEGAWRRLGEAWPEIEHSNFLRLRTRRIDVLLLRARVGLALLSRRPELQPELQRVIEGDVAQLEAEPHTFTIGLTILLRAGLLALDGHSEQVLEYLDAAVISFEVHGMLLMAACASWCKGVWIGGREGRKLVRKAEAFMSMQGVAAPERWIELHAPGLVSVAADPS